MYTRMHVYMDPVFDKIWTESKLPQSDEKLKQACKKIINTYLMVPEVSNIIIDGPYPECSTCEEDMTFDIHYVFAVRQRRRWRHEIEPPPVSKECSIQINYSSGSEACVRNIPTSIAIQ